MIPKIINYSTIILLVLSVIFSLTFGFNLSPKPNLIFKEPNVKTFMPKVRSSYFGFTINLRENSIIIGAPRAQSTLESQRKINETGAIYKCNHNTLECTPYIFDTLGNINEEYNQYAYNMEKKDFQWLGMSMDGNSLESDKFVVCTPRVLADIGNYELMNGLCYLTLNTSDAKPLNIHKIAPLRFKDRQQVNLQGQHYYYYMFGEQGLSVHITENNEEIIIGTPGLFHWKGSIIRYKSQIRDEIGGLSRRDQLSQQQQQQQQQQHSVGKRAIYEYVSDVPNPYLWHQQDNSYFGYAVSSGYFEGPDSIRILYVASAPQANLQQGEVYIFDIVDQFSDKTIKIYYTFMGKQMGEFFGYALLTEDFNNDRYTDIAVTAPFYGKTLSYDNGAVYIFKNLGAVTTNGKWSESFELQTVLITTYDGPGRFGTSISKLGDLNQDGYNDIAVGAPYEDNGVVYIYMGSQNGIISTPSQRIAAPTNDLFNPSTLSAIFGHGLSKGVDIDKNNYIDIAVGAPNNEIVYVYKSYPVVKLITSINSLSQTLEAKDSTFNIRACWSLQSKYALLKSPRINIKIKIDQHSNRAMFPDKLNHMEINTTIDATEKCSIFEVSVTFSLPEIFKPIELEMQSEILDAVPDSDVFCETCVAVNPIDSKFSRNKISFSTGCKSEICIADLSIKSSILNAVLPYVIGSSKSITIEYVVQNTGETAYLAQIKIQINETMMSFMRIPSNCQLIEKDLLCDLKNGKPLPKEDKAYLTIILDTTKIDGIQQQQIIKAEVFSTGDEGNLNDNKIENVIPLAEFSDIEVSGKSSKPLISLKDGLKIENITHTIEIRNNGPSNIKNMEVVISIPVSYLDPWTLGRTDIIDFNNIYIKSEYNNKQFEVEWSQNNTILIQNPIESSSTANLIVENLNDFSENEIRKLDYISNVESNVEQLFRQRRHVPEIGFRGFNRNYNYYTQSIPQYHYLVRRSITYQEDSILKNLPPNRTILFDCYNFEDELCYQATFNIHNFKADNNPIIIQFNFTIDLNRIDKIVTEKRDIFIFKTRLQLRKTDDEESETINTVQALPYTIISKYIISITPLWIYIVSIIGGLLALILITYGLYKFGFFRRTKKEELQKLKRESQAIHSPEVAATDDDE